MANNSSTIITRSSKGTPLAFTEVDANFVNLNTDKVAASGGDMTSGTINSTTIGATTRSSGRFTTLDANGNVILGDASGDTVTVNGTVTPASSSAIGLLVAGTSTGAMLKITQEGTGDVFVVEDVASDSTPFKIDNAGNVTIGGNLTVDGTTTTINSTTVDIDDLNITLAKGSGSSSAADGAGLTIDIGGSNPTLVYTHTGTKFTSSLDFDLASGKVYKINNVEVLSASALTIGTLGYSATGLLTSLTSSVAGYNQLIVRNTNTGATASSSIITNNNLSTDSTYYGDFGMNSSGWSGTGLSAANAVFLTATTAPLMIGTTTDNNVEIWTGATPVQSLSIAGATGITTISQLLLTTKLAVLQGGTGGSTAGIGLFNNITGYTASGATGTTSTNLVFSTSPVLTTPTLAATPAANTNTTAIADTAFVRRDGGFANMQLFTSATTVNTTWTIPAGAVKVKVTAIGSGGGGGGVTAVPNAAGAGGGGGGLSQCYFVGLTPGNTIGYTITAFGTAGANTGGAGGNGGATTVGSINSATQTGLTSLVANGGIGGGGATTNVSTLGGAGATIGSGPANAYFATGNPGLSAYGAALAGGNGANGPFGGGGGQGKVATTGTGTNAPTASYGAGGGGALGATANIGGTGGQGAVIFEW